MSDQRLIGEIPTKRSRSYVYIIGQAHDGPVKIGVSTKPRNRLHALQASNPAKLRILAKFRGDRDLEAAVHRLLGAYRLQGEWFERSVAVRTFIDNVLRGIAIEGMVIEHVSSDNSWDEVLSEEWRKAHSSRSEKTTAPEDRPSGAAQSQQKGAQCHVHSNR
jgi:hypothetical protein